MANKGLDPRKVASLIHNPQNLVASIEQREAQIAVLEERLTKLKEDLGQLKKLLEAAATPNAKVAIKYDGRGELGKKIDGILAEKVERVGHHHNSKVVLVYNPKGLTGKRIDTIMSASLQNMKDIKKVGFPVGILPAFRYIYDKGVNEVERMERDEDEHGDEEEEEEEEEEEDGAIRFQCPVAQAGFRQRYLAAKKRLGIK